MSKTNCNNCYHWDEDGYCISGMVIQESCIWFVDREEALSSFQYMQARVRNEAGESDERAQNTHIHVPGHTE